MRSLPTVREDGGLSGSQAMSLKRIQTCCDGAKGGSRCGIETGRRFVEGIQPDMDEMAPRQGDGKGEREIENTARSAVNPTDLDRLDWPACPRKGTHVGGTPAPVCTHAAASDSDAATSCADDPRDIGVVVREEVQQDFVYSAVGSAIGLHQSTSD